MKKSMIILTGALIMSLTGLTYAQQTQNRPKVRERLRNAMEIRQEMREIERQAIENDAELQGIMNKIRELHQQLREKLDAKLANNSEYQQLKKQLEEMREEWKGQGPKGPLPEPGTGPKSQSGKINQQKGK
ncbi:MAG TPA: hypothetical protein PLQ41_00860 [bacterium]|nr:hypothetical protein [bacterium]HPP30482.1 hypothetical protein [bacterium]